MVILHWDDPFQHQEGRPIWTTWIGILQNIATTFLPKIPSIVFYGTICNNEYVDCDKMISVVFYESSSHLLDSTTSCRRAHEPVSTILCQSHDVRCPWLILNELRMGFRSPSPITSCCTHHPFVINERLSILSNGASARNRQLSMRLLSRRCRLPVGCQMRNFCWASAMVDHLCDIAERLSTIGHSAEMDEGVSWKRLSFAFD